MIKVFLKYLNSKRANIAVITVLMVTVFLGILALVVDLGYLYREKNRYKNATDAASLAAALYIYNNRYDPIDEVKIYSEEQARIIAEENNILNDNDHLRVAFGFYDVNDEYQDFVSEEGFITGKNFTEEGSSEFQGKELVVNAVYSKASNDVETFLSKILGRETVCVSAYSLACAHLDEEQQQGIMYKWCHEYVNTPEGCPFCNPYGTPAEHAVFPGGFHNYVEDVHIYLGGRHGKRKYYLHNEASWGETHAEGQLSFFDEQDFEYKDAKELTVYLDTNGWFDAVCGEHARGGIGAVSADVIEQVRYGGFGDDRFIIKTKRDNPMTTAPDNYTVIGGQNGLQCYLDGVEVYAASTYYRDNLSGRDPYSGKYGDWIKTSFGDVRINHLPQGSAGNECEYKLRVIAKGNIHIGHDEDAGEVFTFNGDFVANSSNAPLFLSDANIIIDEASVFKNGYIHANGHIVINYYDYTKVDEENGDDYPLGYNILFGPSQFYWMIYRNGEWQYHKNGEWPIMGVEYPGVVWPVFQNCTVTCSDTIILRHRYCDPTGDAPPEAVKLNATHYYIDEEVNSVFNGQIAGNQPTKSIPWDWETGDTNWDWGTARTNASKVYTTDYCPRDYADTAMGSSFSENPVSLVYLDKT